MQRFFGDSIVDGVVISKCLIYKKNNIKIQKTYIENVNREIKRFNDAVNELKEELKNSYEYTKENLSVEDADIFKVQQGLLEDADYYEEIINYISLNKINSEYAITKITDSIIETFNSIPDGYIKERCVDIKENSKKLINILGNNYDDEIEIKEPCIILAEDLVATDVIHLDKKLVKGIILQKGTSTSHASILIKNKNIPYIIHSNITLYDEYNNKDIIMDNHNIYLNPDISIIKMLQKKQEELEQDALNLKKLIGQEDVTLDGKHLNLFCNIGNVSDINDVLMNDGKGIGLFRSEFIFIEKNDFPSENEQFEIYKEIAEKLGDKLFIIRTIDIGSDKDADYFNLKKEENPALGYRAIRICLDRKDIFKTQLRAIYRASNYGNIAIMFPMIIAEEEIIEIKQLLEEIKNELIIEKIPFKEIQIGIMIETPSAVILSDILAKHVDFFSIGSNDLTQYTLAIDRQNLKLSNKYNMKNKAILRMIYQVIQNAHKENIWVGMCGELASDDTLIDLFLCMGIDELSVAPNTILKLRKKIRNFNIEENKENLLSNYNII